MGKLAKGAITVLAILCLMAASWKAYMSFTGDPYGGNMEAAMAWSNSIIWIALYLLGFSHHEEKHRD